MTHSAIKAMIKAQYELKDEDNIIVKLVSSKGNTHKFRATDQVKGENKIRTTIIMIKSECKFEE